MITNINIKKKEKKKATIQKHDNEFSRENPSKGCDHNN